MKEKESLKQFIFLILKGTASALAGIIGLMAGGVIVKILSLPQPEIPEGINTNFMMLGFFLCWILTSIILGQISRRIKLKFFPRFVFIFLLQYFVENFLNILEAHFFIMNFPVVSQMVSSIFPVLFIAISVTFLWPVEPDKVMLIVQIKNFFGKRSILSWVWRILLSWISFTLIYLAIGMIINPIVVPIYQDPSNGLNLTIPAMGIIISLQLLRGGVTLMIILPFIIFWKTNKMSLFLLLSTVLITMVPLTGMIGVFQWPLVLRITHGIELTVDYFLLIFVYTQLLAVKNKRISSDTL